MTAAAVSRPSTDEAARGARTMALAQIDKRVQMTFDEIRDRRDAGHQRVLAASMARTRRALVGVHVDETGRLIGDPFSVGVAVSVLSSEPERYRAELAAVQAAAETEWAAARADRDQQRKPFQFGGARVRLHVLSPATSQEA